MKRPPEHPDELPKLARAGLRVIWLNMELTLCGLVAMIDYRLTDDTLSIVWYAYAALFIGVPLFLLQLVLAPANLLAFRQPVGVGVRRYRRYFLLNLLFVLVLWLVVPWLLRTAQDLIKPS